MPKENEQNVPWQSWQPLGNRSPGWLPPSSGCGRRNESFSNRTVVKASLKRASNAGGRIQFACERNWRTGRSRVCFRGNFSPVSRRIEGDSPRSFCDDASRGTENFRRDSAELIKKRKFVKCWRKLSRPPVASESTFSKNQPMTRSFGNDFKYYNTKILRRGGVQVSRGGM